MSCPHSLYKLSRLCRPRQLENRGLPPLLCIAVRLFQRNPCTGRNLTDPGLNALVGTSVQQKTYDINMTCELRLHAKMAATCGVLSAQDVPPEGLQWQKPLELQFKRNCCQKIRNQRHRQLHMNKNSTSGLHFGQKTESVSAVSASCTMPCPYSVYKPLSAMPARTTSNNRSFVASSAVYRRTILPAKAMHREIPSYTFLATPASSNRRTLRLHAERPPPAACFQYQKACSGRNLAEDVRNHRRHRQPQEKKGHIRFAHPA